MKVNLLHLKVIGKGPPLVLLHGWGWHSGIWSPLIPYLADKFQLFMPDLPGFGKTPVLTSDYTFEAIAPYLFEKIPEKATWAGWSLGGLFAWWVAIHYPEKVSRLITIAASPKFVSEEHWPGIPLPVLEKFAKNLINESEKTLNDFLALQLRGSPHQVALLAELKKQFLPPEMPALLGGLEWLRTTDLRAELSHMAVPSLHIFGSLDTLVPVNITRFLKPLLLNGHCEVMQRAGHIPFLTWPERFIEVLIK
jgi:pimeloyl-[acyl-carrier protein] methyl ester esterase